MRFIRPAAAKDFARLAEIEIFNYRLFFYPIFQNDEFYFDELQVPSALAQYQQDKSALSEVFVYDDGVVKGFIRISGTEIKKLFVEPALQGRGIGAVLLAFATDMHQCDNLWALEKNTRAIAFYKRYGFSITAERKTEEDTDEYLVRLAR
ncbi:MAG: GNAT family N-acetyltransferase [Clostridia bacterium]|nr:GNAT family N-acetyltransferase [Clostridia bacterium]